MGSEITHKQVQACYELGKQVLAGDISAPEATAVLAEQHGMNKVSAQAYVYTVQHMLAGEEYRRTANAYATRYFLSSIRRDFGEAALKRARL